MQIVYVSIPTVETVQEFVERISPLNGQLDFLSGGYVIDAKSLMSIFGLNIKEPLALRVENDTEEAMQAISRYIVCGPPTEGVERGDLEEKNG